MSKFVYRKIVFLFFVFLFSYYILHTTYYISPTFAAIRDFPDCQPGGTAPVTANVEPIENSTDMLLNALVYPGVNKEIQENPQKDKTVCPGISNNWLTNIVKIPCSLPIIGNFCPQSLSLGSNTVLFDSKTLVWKNANLYPNLIYEDQPSNKDVIQDTSSSEVGDKVVSAVADRAGLNYGNYFSTDIPREVYIEGSKTPVKLVKRLDENAALKQAGNKIENDERTTQLCPSADLYVTGTFYPGFTPKALEECAGFLSDASLQLNLSSQKDFCASPPDLNQENYFLGAFGLPLQDTSNLEKKKLNATSYWSLLVPEVSTGGIPLTSPSGKKGPGILEHDWCSASMEGSIRVKKLDGSVETYSYAGHEGSSQVSGSCWNGAVSNTRFEKVNVPFGRGAYSKSVIPYRTIAVDKNEIPYGSVIYIPSVRGKEIIDSSGNKVIHDGYFFAGDAGGAIKKNHIDVFIGGTDKSELPAITDSFVSKTSFEAFLVKDQTIIDYLSSLNSNNCIAPPQNVIPGETPQTGDYKVEVYAVFDKDQKDLDNPKTYEKIRTMLSKVQNFYQEKTGKSISFGGLQTAVADRDVDYLNRSQSEISNDLAKIINSGLPFPEKQVSLIFVNGKITKPLWGGVTYIPGSNDINFPILSLIADSAFASTLECDTADDPACNLGFLIIAHELGHAFGLGHVRDEDNLMCGGEGCGAGYIKDSNLTQSQIEKVKLSPFLK